MSLPNIQWMQQSVVVVLAAHLIHNKKGSRDNCAAEIIYNVNQFSFMQYDQLN
jgi:hypothetical protein